MAQDSDVDIGFEISRAFALMDQGKAYASDNNYRDAGDKFQETISVLMAIMPVVKSESTKTMLQKQLHLVMDVSEGCKSRLRRMTQSKGKGGSMLDMLLKQTEEKEKTLDEKERKKRVTRNHVAGEVYSTERAYVTNLKILQSRYVDPLREASKTSLPILSASDVATLFSTLEAVPKLNERFVEDVGKRVKNWHALQTIGDVFDEYAPFFKTYLVYVQCFEKMSKRLLVLRKENERFRMFLEYLEMKERLPPLQSLLIMPVQRIPRYQLLIRDLIKNTHDTHPDYKLLNKALGKIANTAKHINDSMNRQKRALKLYEIQGLFLPHKKMPPIVAPNREHIKDGPLRKLNRHGEVDGLNFWLFTDVLVYGLFNMRKNAYEFRRMITPIGCEIAVYKGYANGLKIASTEKSLILFAWTEEEQQEWLKAIQETADRNKKRNHNLRHRGSLIMRHTAAPLKGEASRSVVISSENSKARMMMGMND
eukprot:g6416.t1